MRMQTSKSTFKSLYANPALYFRNFIEEHLVSHIHLSQIRPISTTTPCFVNANDGSDTDRTEDIADAYRRDREGIENYFKDKENSINKHHSDEVISAELRNVSEEEMQILHKEHVRLLMELSGQMDDAKDLASIYSTDSNQESSNEANEESQGEGEVTEEDSYHPQDTSDITQTDFNDFTFHEE